jgi:hypothetical protein
LGQYSDGGVESAWIYLQIKLQGEDICGYTKEYMAVVEAAVGEEEGVLQMGKLAY